MAKDRTRREKMLGARDAALHAVSSDRDIACDLPAAVAIMPGEAELVHFHLADLLAQLFE
jgi:hypothetical protein